MKKKIDTDRIPAEAFDKMKAKHANRVEPIDNTELVKEFRAKGGRILHIRPGHGNTRGLTVAYVVKGGRIEMATGCQHRNDDFTKKMGTKTSIEHFNAGKTVHLPVSDGRDFNTNTLKWSLSAFA